MDPEKDAGLMIGRFQPFHKGHLRIVKRIIEERGFAKIAVGSAQYSHTAENPFSFEEREGMIRAALEEDGVEGSRYHIYCVPDIHNYPRWVAHVEGIVGDYGAVYTANPVNVRLFREKGREVVVHELHDGISATKIRELMAEGKKSWKEMVPDAVAERIERLDVRKRLNAG